LNKWHDIRGEKFFHMLKGKFCWGEAYGIMLEREEGNMIEERRSLVKINSWKLLGTSIPTLKI
jgi:hypothetical protein